MKPASGTLGVVLLHPDEMERHASLLRRHGLGAVAFGPAAPTPSPLPIVHVNLRHLLTPEPIMEVWLSGDPVTGGTTGRIAWRRSDTHVFGSIQADAESRLQDVTEQLYGELFRFLDAAGYPHLVRVWNYFPDINRESDGLERYRQFNIGRQNAFLGANHSVTAGLPAACALGTSGGALTIYFIASCKAPVPIENPRQVSAYRYPSEYGPRSPTFSRASLLRSERQVFVFISGTASIVGHRSLHANDLTAQTGETLANIASLIDAINRDHADTAFKLDDFQYKVYLRPGCDPDRIQSQLAFALSSPVPTIFLEADICRSDLLVEIEAIGARSL